MKTIAVFFRKISTVFLILAKKFSPETFENKNHPFKRQFINWGKDKGDLTLRLDYPLDNDSVVFDLGGYVGTWVSDIYSKYNCRVYVFEPHPDFFSFSKKRFEKNTSITLYPFGLGAKDEKILLSSDEFSSSAFSQDKPMEIDGLIKQFSSFVSENDITSIDLMKINIEGGEFDLLESLISTGWHTKIKNIQVQFHIFVPEAMERRQKIREQLKLTHQCTYNYEFVWENWKLKDA